MRKTTFVLAGAAFIAVVSSGLFAQDDSSDLFADMGASDAAASPASSGAAASASDFDLKLSGTHDFNYHLPIYWADGNKTYANANSPELKKPTFTNDVGVEVKDGNLKLVSRWALNATTAASEASSANPNSSWAASATIKPLENYVSWSPSKYKLSFGYQIFSWGVADRKNPTDNLNPKDYTVGVNADKIPVLAADAVWYASDKVSIEGVAIPLKPVSQYPEDFAGLVSAKATAAGQSVTTAYASSNDPKDFVAGAKVNYNSSVVDLSFDYLYDMDQYYTPEISIVKPGVTFPYVMTSISLDRKRIHRFGGDAKTTFGKFGLWLESAYSLTENDGSSDYSVRKSRLDYTLGTDVNYGPNDTFYVNLQYIGTWIPGYDKDFNANSAEYKTASLYTDGNYALDYYQRAMVNSLGLETEGLLQGVTANMKWELADALVTPQVTAVYTMPFFYDKTDETRYGALVVNPEIDLKPVDSFHIKFGADLYYAWHKVKGNDGITLDTATNAIGAYTPSNNVYLKVEYKWNANVKK